MNSKKSENRTGPETPDLMQAERDELRGRLRWRSDEFDVEPLRGPSSRTPDAAWIIRVGLGKRAVLLRQPQRGHIQLDTGRRGKGARPSTGTSNPSEAIEFAEEWLASEREEALFDAGIQAVVDRATVAFDVSDVCRLVHKTDLPHKRSWPRYERACLIARATLKPGFQVERIDKEAIAGAIKARMEGLPTIGLRPVCAVTAVGNLKDFSTVLSRVGALKDANHKRFFSNPIKDMEWPDELEVRGNGKRPRKERIKKKKRDPFSLEQMEMLLSEFRYIDGSGRAVVLPAPVDVVDRTGALRLIIMIALFTGRRFEAILQLLFEDLVFSVQAMRGILEAADEEARRDWADHFTFGIINFPGEWDKESYHWPVPISSVLRSAIDQYLAAQGLTSGPLFPSVRNPAKPLDQSTVSRFPWIDAKGRLKMGRFDRAWRLAREYLTAAGRDPDDLMPVRKGYKIHRVRGCFATLMARLGYGRANTGENDDYSYDDHVNYIGGWALSKAVKDDHYIPLDPEVLMGVVEWKKAEDVLGKRARIEGAIATRVLQGIGASVSRMQNTEDAEGAA